MFFLEEMGGKHVDRRETVPWKPALVSLLGRFASFPIQECGVVEDLIAGQKWQHLVGILEKNDGVKEAWGGFRISFTSSNCPAVYESHIS